MSVGVGLAPLPFRPLASFSVPSLPPLPGWGGLAEFPFSCPRDVPVRRGALPGLTSGGGGERPGGNLRRGRGRAAARGWGTRSGLEAG